MSLIKDALNALKIIHTKFHSIISNRSPMVVRQSRGTGASQYRGLRIRVDGLGDCSLRLLDFGALPTENG